MALPGNTPLVETQDAPSGYQRRQLAGQCTRNGCPHDAVDGSDMCSPHTETERKRIAAAVQKLRDKRRAASTCIDCPADKPTKVAKGQSLCAAHRIERDRYAERLATGVTENVTTRGDRLPDFRVSAFPGEEGRTRFHGKGRKGQPSIAAQDDADLVDVAKTAERARTAFAYAHSDEVKALGRIQREGAMRAALAIIELAERFIADVKQRHRKVSARLDP